MNYRLIVLLIILSPAFAAAQPRAYTTYNAPLVFRHLTRADGLASNSVHTILQDHRGFMWFGTSKGLNRYDGHSFNTWNFDPADSSGISDNDVFSLYEDRKGRLWIGTVHNGLAMYDEVTQKFTCYRHSDKDPNSINYGRVSQICEDSSGRFWVCLYRMGEEPHAGGLELFDEHTGKFTHHMWNPADSEGLAGNKVKAICETARGKFLVGTFESGNYPDDHLRWGHINQYDAATNKFSRLWVSGVTHKPTDIFHYHYLERLVQDIKPDQAGNIWFGTYCGILKYSPATNRFKVYEKDDTDPETLADNNVHSVCERNGNMIFGTDRGISVMDTGTGRVTNFSFDPANPNSLSDNAVTMIYKDRENRLWIATANGGINILEPPNKDFTLYPNALLRVKESSVPEENTIETICKGKNDEIYVGSYSGLSILNTRTNAVRLLQPSYVREVKYASSKVKLVCPVFSMLPSASGKYWLGGMGQIMTFDPEKNTITTDQNFLHAKDRPYVRPVRSVFENPDGSLYVSVEFNRLKRFLPATGRFADKDTIPIVGAPSIVKDSRGNLWFGLQKIDPSGLITKYSHLAADTNSVISRHFRWAYAGRNNKLWFITEGRLDQFDFQADRFIHIRHISNFPDTALNCMIEDRWGDAWFLSDEALIRYNPASGAVTRYLANLDLPVHKLENRMIYDSVNDVIYFTAQEGLVSFHPRMLKSTFSPPPLYITNFKLFNKIAVFDSAANIKKVYHLAHNDNFITLNFSALNYAHPELNQYAYKLEGLDKDWNYSGSGHEANFTNLAPGKYIFRLKGSSREGTWDQEIAPVTIIISPPWWFTGWFFVLSIVFISGGLIAYNRYRTNIFTRQRIKLEKTVEQRTLEYREQKDRAETSEKFRQQFLANMSHEIRTPMNAVSGMTDILLERNPRPDQLNYLNAISKSSDILLHILDDILNLSKIEAGKLELENVDFSLSGAIAQVKDTLTYRAEEKGLELTTSISSDITDVVKGDPFRLNQVLINLVGNALKFTDKGGVHIRVKKISEDSQNIALVFSVTDTGIGIPEEKLHILFESFMQVHSSDTRKYAGTGLGLAVSKKLVELQGGSMGVESSEGRGATFSFTIPYTKGSVLKLRQRRQDEQKADPHILNGLKILLAEDNEYNRMLVSETLITKAEIHVDIAVNGEEAVALVRRNDYDVVLMDVQMPVLSGLEATRYIRDHLPAPKNKVPVIAFTASILRTDIDMCTRAGMNGYIPKPFKPWQLITAIAELTGRKEPETDATRGITIGSELAAYAPPGITNLAYLSSFCEGNKRLEADYIRMYLNALPPFEKTAGEAMAAGDLAAVARIMHTFKPKWAMMGMQLNMDIAAETELLCQDMGNVNAISENISLLIVNNQKSVSELESFV